MVYNSYMATHHAAMKNLPSVGSLVEVKTRHRDHFYFSDKEYVEYTYKGKVLDNPKWVEYNSFVISSDVPDIDFHIISPRNVVDIKYIEGNIGKEIDDSPQLFKVKNYTVFKSKSGYRCTCVGYQYHKKCKHIKQVIEGELS